MNLQEQQFATRGCCIDFFVVGVFYTCHFLTTNTYWLFDDLSF